MIFSRSFFWLAVAALLAPQAAFAAAEGGMGFVWEAANLLLLLTVLFFAARKPVSAYLADRRHGIVADMESSEKLLLDAEERLADWGRRADGVEDETAEIRRAARAAAEAEAAGIVADAEATAERIKNGAQAAIDSELRRARAALQQDAAELAVSLAGDLLRDNVTDADQDRLVDEFATRLERGEAA